MLGVNRKTVALALRRERLTNRMTLAVQRLMANADDPTTREVLPLDRVESQIRFLLESVDELDELVDKLTRRVEALEEAQERVQMKVDADVQAADDVVEVFGDAGQSEPTESSGPRDERAEPSVGWWRR